MKQVMDGSGQMHILSPKYEQAEKKINPLIQKGILSPCDCYISHKTMNGADVFESLIISHDGCRKIAASELLEGKRIDPKGFASRETTVGYDVNNRPIICVLYEYRDDAVFANGESTEQNNSFGYPYAMAYKRCYDRAVLEKSGLSELGIHSKEESEDFKKATPMQEDISASVETIRPVEPTLKEEVSINQTQETKTPVSVPVKKVVAPVAVNTSVVKPTPKAEPVLNPSNAADQVVLPAREETPVMTLEEAMQYTFRSGKLAGMKGEAVMLNPKLKVFVTAVGNVKTGAEQAAAKAIAGAMA